MPQVIHKPASSEKPNVSNFQKKSTGNKFPSDISEVPKPMLIGAGVVILFFFLFMLDHYVIRLRPAAPPYVKVAPPPGYPDTYPYNDKSWQDAGKPVLSGMPPLEAMQKMKTSSTPATGQ